MMENNTRVLLVIVSNPQSYILPHNIFYTYFINFGEVIKILIFEKGKLTKCFIEMGSEQQARNALQGLNQLPIYPNTVMNVYYSNLHNVTFVNNNSGGVDYRQIKIRNPLRSNTYNEGLQKKTVQFQEESFSIQSQSQNSQTSFENNRTRASSNMTQEMINRQTNLKKMHSLDIQDDESENSANKIMSLKSIGQFSEHLRDEIKEQENFDRVYNYNSLKQIDLEIQEQTPEDDEEDDDDSDIRQAFSSEKNFNFIVPEVEYTTPQQSQQVDPYTYISPQFLRENQPSKVVYIRGLSHPQIQPINIFNLLSNCGNVVVIIFIKNKTSALVQFEKLIHAQNALDHLNNQVFFGSKLKIFYSNYQEIQFPLPTQSPQTQIYIPDQTQLRFSEQKSISFNPPSQILHLSNIKGQLCESEEHIVELFRGIGTVQGIKFIHPDKQKHMALVRLSSIEEALNGAALLHGKEVMNRKINVSFTKSKLC